ncbi:hypothetical protein DYB26_003617 [Aphanomyces astaci]|uniref:GTP-binding protein LepA C-terminal domain-containing protein n=1 Tax=Aphanomyces astaci TaxID=112090 RepID=A0A3R7B1Y7_APHAT|nr:hypothetical protein DYB26_003617 [Aphanomyces astaci]
MAGLQRETPLTAFSDLVKEWEKCVAQGTSRLTQIANANQKLSHADGESWAGLADANALHVTLRHKGDIIVNMRALCFLDVSSSRQDYEIDPTLSRLHYGTFDRLQIPHNTMCVIDLYLQQLVEMYQQELMAKALIAVDIVESSLNYREVEPQQSDIVKVDILINGKILDALSFVCHRSKATAAGRALCLKLKNVIDRQQYEISIQATLGAKVFAKERIAPFRKDVLIKSGKAVGGGDITRKQKLLKKQKEGKKRMKTVGNVQLSQNAFWSVMSK